MPQTLSGTALLLACGCAAIGFLAAWWVRGRRLAAVAGLLDLRSAELQHANDERTALRVQCDQQARQAAAAEAQRDQMRAALDDREAMVREIAVFTTRVQQLHEDLQARYETTASEVQAWRSTVDELREAELVRLRNLELDRNGAAAQLHTATAQIETLAAELQAARTAEQSHATRLAELESEASDWREQRDTRLYELQQTVAACAAARAQAEMASRELEVARRQAALADRELARLRPALSELAAYRGRLLASVERTMHDGRTLAELKATALQMERTLVNSFAPPQAVPDIKEPAGAPVD